MINQIELFSIIEKKALEDNKIYIVCGDGLDTCYFPKMVKYARDRIIACGISEQNQVSIATGLALQEKKVYCLMMNAFLVHRALDQLKMACYSNVDINFLGYSSNIMAINGGYSHISIDDFAILKNTPNLSIYDPYTIEELNEAIEQTYNTKTPSYISCVARSNDNLNKGKRIKPNREFSKILQGANDFCLITSGDAINYLIQDNFLPNLSSKISVPTIYSAYHIEPFDKKGLISILKKYKYLIVFEIRGEGALCSTISEIIAKNNLKIKYFPIYLQNERYDIVGFRNYVISKYLGLANLPETIKKFFKYKKGIVLSKKYKIDPHSFEVTIKHKFLGITYCKQKYSP